MPERISQDFGGILQVDGHGGHIIGWSRLDASVRVSSSPIAGSMHAASPLRAHALVLP